MRRRVNFYVLIVAVMNLTAGCVNLPSWTGKEGTVKIKRLTAKDTRTVHISADRKAVCVSPLPATNLSDFRRVGLTAGTGETISQKKQDSPDKKVNQTESTKDTEASGEAEANGVALGLASYSYASQSVKSEFLKNAFFQLCNERLNGHLSEKDYPVALGQLIYAATAFIIGIEGKDAKTQLEFLQNVSTNLLLSGLSRKDIVRQKFSKNQKVKNAEIVQMVEDGDTLILNGYDIRLWGIDSPELKNRDENMPDENKAKFHDSCWPKNSTALDRENECAKKAIRYMIGIIKESSGIECTIVDVTRRDTAVCSTENGTDIGLSMVKKGYAVDYYKYSKGAYAEAEKSASKEGIRSEAVRN